MKTNALIVLAVLVIATIALTGAASAATAAPFTTAVSAQAHGQYYGIEARNGVTGIPEVSYTSFAPTGYTLTVSNGSATKTVNVGIKNVKGVITPDLTGYTPVSGFAVTNDADTAVHTFNMCAKTTDTSIIFENGKPVSVIGANGASTPYAGEGFTFFNAIYTKQ